MKTARKIQNLLLSSADQYIGYSVFPFEGSLIHPKFHTAPVFEKKPRSIRHFQEVFQIADPFMFAWNETLYCFFEEKCPNLPGVLKVASTNDLINWLEESCQLNTVSHVSFPFVFNAGSEIFMIPETASVGEVALYAPLDFPLRWEKKVVLLNGPYVDSHIVHHNNFYYLFTTRKIASSTPHLHRFDYSSELHIAERLTGPYQLHPSSPIKTGRKYGRSAGAILQDEGFLYRLSQDSETSYGRDIGLFRILKLSPSMYEEEWVIDDWIRKKVGHATGGHHLSIVKFKDTKLAAIDMNYQDAWVQRFIKLWGRKK